MDIKTALKIKSGQITYYDCSIAETMQLMMDACLTDNGDIICLKCGKLNECCNCDQEVAE